MELCTSKLVSIVVPTYNQMGFIAETIESVLVQTYNNLEVIISDDCSTDGTVEILKQFQAQDSRIKLLLAEKNQGIPANFNKAFDAVTGEFVAFLGGDDLMYPSKIEELVKVLNANPDAGLVYSDMRIKNSKTGETSLHSKKGIYNQPLDWVLKIDWYLEKDTGILPSACLARSEYYLQARYDQRFYLKHELWFTAEDYYKNPDKKWIYCDKVLGEYKIHGSNFSETEEAKNTIIDETFLVADLCLENFPESEERVEEHLKSFAFGNLVRNEDKSILPPRFSAIYDTFDTKQRIHLFFSRRLLGTRLFPIYRSLAKVICLA